MTETLVPQVETAPQKRLFIKTYGCQMNVYDSERMADVLRPLGYGVTDDVKAADFVILNTCHIREKAAEKIYSELGKLREMRAILDSVAESIVTIDSSLAAGASEYRSRMMARPTTTPAPAETPCMMRNTHR